MDKFGKSQTVTRFEDPRLLKGEGRYVDDIAPDGALFAFFLRSPIAHAKITTLDTSDARAADGVHLVLTAADLEDAGVRLNLAAALVKNRDGSKGAAPARPILAKDRICFVGEAVALVVAETLHQARDAAELIEFDYEELEPALALAEGGPEIHPEAPGNLAYDWAMGDEAATDAAFANAAHTVSLDVGDNRIIVNSMEPRGMYADWSDGRLHVCYNGQGVWGLKTRLAKHLGLTEEQVHVTTPDVGGGFGMKGFTYPEHYAVAQAARQLAKPVRWMSDRTEAMLTDNGGRDLTSVAELAFDADYKITGYRVNNISNLGAYNSEFAQNIQSVLFSKVLTGAYDIPTAFLATKGVFTNTVPIDAYRGAGRPEAIYVLERVMDHAARVLGIDPWDLRRRNLIPADAFPYRTVSDQLYDVGDFHRVLARVQDVADVTGFEARKKASEANGKLRGLGLCYYIESILGDPTEGAKIEFCEDGTVNLYVGTQSNGQGHETVYAQFLADQSGIPVEHIRIIQGDSDLIAKGGGTGGSRSVTIQSAATLVTVEETIRAFTPFIAGEMGVGEEAVRFDDGTFRAEGSNQSPTLMEAAELARAKGREDLLVHQAEYELEGRSYPNGAHVAEVEIDPETGVTEVVKYSVTDDFGNLMNPMLAEGQVHGGIVQGIGQAINERVVYDEDGQLLTATFMDYAVPRAREIPQITFTTEPVPSTANALGMKGCGEAGTVGALAAVTNGVLDALWARGVRHVDMPFTPNRVWSMIEEAAGAAG
ncbi:xanthine dehydrogenase family protein molybdopterin-binding subunit [Actibacterium lipolyticum]|uniref:Carbon monoxide dehydrogenase large chain n=1 Tax=Actibacterium lipolyticum TaxID=1524263 RepID=A0A238JRA4_9RHOB|nr:xanthine dehydrogenase family protein molybdopterin-binding subunit [Actibacterium lipolyticum]SMX32993.1 Carbon monoxide dehydrogenase large chain [Actibacterium lipolyticum]